MPKLNQVVAVEKTAKSTTEAEKTQAFHALQHADSFSGLIRTYRPLMEGDTDIMPPEHQKVVAKAETLLSNFCDYQTALFDITATKVWGNMTATANVVVDGETVLVNVPVEYLLFLESKLADVRTFLSKVPTLNPSVNWHYDDAVECYKSDPVETRSTKKVLRNHVKAKATDKFAEQVEVYTEDVPVGIWTKTQMSGAVYASAVTAWRARLDKLIAAVKYAREDANSIEVTPIEVGQRIFEYLFA